MFTLCIDIQKIILEFLEPKEIIKLCNACKNNSEQMLKELTKYTNFIVKCNYIIPQSYVKWFKSKNIQISLLKRHIIYKNYSEKYYLNGLLHRKDGPAVISHSPNKGEEWYKNGLLHREDGPAITLNGRKEWYKNGLLHRDDGPAITLTNGREEWYKYGLRHRDDGPAFMVYEYFDYDMNQIPELLSIWYQNGLKHRIGGPALIWESGKQEYWENGNIITRCGLKKQAKRKRKQNQ